MMKHIIGQLAQESISYHTGVGYWHAYKQDPQMTGTGNHRR